MAAGERENRSTFSRNSTFPLALSWWEENILDLKTSLTHMATHILPPFGVLGKPVAWEADLRKHPRDFCAFVFSPCADNLLAHILLLAASLLPHPFTSAQLGSSSPLPHSFLARLSHSNPFPTPLKPCIHLAWIWSLPRWLALRLLWVLPAPTNADFWYRL